MKALFIRLMMLYDTDSLGSSRTFGVFAVNCGLTVGGIIGLL
jgi:hypothetical protein